MINGKWGYIDTRTRIAYRNPDIDFKEFEANGEKQANIIKAPSKR